VGNTDVVAKKIQDLTGGDLFEIDTIKSYPENYTETTRVAKDELRVNARPELIAVVDKMDVYDVIYLGYPNWWNTFPMAAFTFLESYDFTGKTIIPFVRTKEAEIASGILKSFVRMQKYYPDWLFESVKYFKFSTDYFLIKKETLVIYKTKIIVNNIIGRPY